jgi:hypothetical protein
MDVSTTMTTSRVRDDNYADATRRLDGLDDTIQQIASQMHSIRLQQEDQSKHAKLLSMLSTWSTTWYSRNDKLFEEARICDELREEITEDPADAKLPKRFARAVAAMEESKRQLDQLEQRIRDACTELQLDPTAYYSPS